MNGTPSPREVVIFYDGECGVCNAFVQFVLDHDRHRSFRYAPLQGSTYAKLYGGPPDLDTIVVREGDRTRTRSDAALRTLGLLGGIFRAALVFYAVPRPLRDFVYDLVAKYRHRVTASCRILTAEERTRFFP